MPLFGNSTKTEEKITTNYNATDNKIGAEAGGYALRGDGITINQTSQSAVDLGLGFGEAAAEIADSAVAAGRVTSRDAIDLASDATEGAFDLSADALMQSLDFGDGLASRAFGFASDMQDAAALTQEAANDVTQRALTSTSGALNAVLADKAEDSAHLSEQFIRLGVPAVAIVLIAWSIRK